MEQGYTELTVFFEDPFWVLLYEREDGGTYEVCRTVFGPEPRDQEVYAFLLEQWRQLRFSPSMAAAARAERKVIPKRMQRQIQKSLCRAGTGTKAQQALQAQREEGRAARKRRSREEREAKRDRRSALRREKRREKHKGH